MLQQRGRGGAAAGARGRAGAQRRAGPRPQPYNRNKFLQANFRFLVSDAADLRRHEADADLMLDWDDVVQVHGNFCILDCNTVPETRISKICLQASHHVSLVLHRHIPPNCPQTAAEVTGSLCSAC